MFHCVDIRCDETSDVRHIRIRTKIDIRIRIRVFHSLKNADISQRFYKYLFEMKILILRALCTYISR